MSLPTGRRKGSCSLWLKRNWVLMSLVGLALASAALSVLFYPVHKSNVAALLPDGGFWYLGSGAGGAALVAAPVIYSTAWRCGSLTACLDSAKKGC